MFDFYAKLVYTKAIMFCFTAPKQLVMLKGQHGEY